MFVVSYKRVSEVSQQAIFASGNLLGPVVNTTIEGGLEKFFRQPTGCGEQTMIYLAPNVYVLEYLMNTNQLSGANEENAYRFIQSGMFKQKIRFTKRAVIILKQDFKPRIAHKLKVIIMKMKPTPKHRKVHLLVSRVK